MVAEKRTPVSLILLATRRLLQPGQSRLEYQPHVGVRWIQNCAVRFVWVFFSANINERWPRNFIMFADPSRKFLNECHFGTIVLA